MRAANSAQDDNEKQLLDLFKISLGGFGLGLRRGCSAANCSAVRHFLPVSV
jgi:hypothetical protein